MKSLTDQQLLADYAKHRTEAAFNELVRRHFDVVHSAALRMVSDPHLGGSRPGGGIRGGGGVCVRRRRCADAGDDRGGVRLHEAVAVGSAPAWTGVLTVPREAYASGVLEVSVNRRGEGTAVVTQLRLVQKNAGLGAEPVTAEVPAAFALEQNYPNPFNPATVIRFAIPADGDVSLKIYDVAGREVATLVNEQRRAGAYEVRYDAQSAGRNLASGVYFYRLQVRPAAGAASAAFSETRKMMLVK